MFPKVETLHETLHLLTHMCIPSDLSGSHRANLSTDLRPDHTLPEWSISTVGMLACLARWSHTMAYDTARKAHVCFTRLFERSVGSSVWHATDEWPANDMELYDHRPQTVHKVSVHAGDIDVGTLASAFPALRRELRSMLVVVNWRTNLDIHGLSLLSESK